jgi:anaphase-promoting complex subunit 6
MLGGLDADTIAQLSLPPLPASTPGTVSYLSAACLLRGKVYDALENFPIATKWYKYALEVDAFNYEAFDLLVATHKLSNEEELALVAGLKIPAEQGWLALLYRSKCKKYSGQDEADAALGEDCSVCDNSFWLVCPGHPTHLEIKWYIA